MNLLEQYKTRVKIAENMYAKNHGGEQMGNHKKIVLAKVLDNTSKFMNEAFDSSNATQRSQMGEFKKFCLNLTNVAIPNLIAPELVIVHPMTSMSGYITYIEYLAGKTKGATDNGDLFNSPFKLGNADPTYTSQSVVESYTATSGQTAFVMSWYPTGTVSKVYNGTTELSADDYTVDDDNHKVTLDSGATVGDIIKIAYTYDNVVIPQNDLPALRAEMKSISLIAKARRIAVYYSQIAAFQAKTDYGFDLGDQLAEKAVGQLAYEIDTEVTQLLIDNATTPANNLLVWSKTLPIGVSKAEHYEGFSEMVEIAKQVIYDRTKRFAPNYMLAASNLLPILSFIKGWSPAPISNVNGPYFAGTLGGLKVFVTPNIAAGKYIVGVNGDDLMTSAAVYAPYMAIVPTMLLQYADGGTSQGFSTLYDLKMLNADLLVYGTVTD